MARSVVDVCRALPGEALYSGTWVDQPVSAALRYADRPVITSGGGVQIVFTAVEELEALLLDEHLTKTFAAAVIAVGTSNPEALATLAECGLHVIIVSDDVPLDVHHAHLQAFLAADDAAEARLISSGTAALTQIVRSGGVEAALAELARRLQGWAVLLDAQGHPIASAGAGLLHIGDATAVALHRPVRVRHPGLQVHPVGYGQDLRAHLVVSSRSAVTSRTRDLSAQAAALIDLVLRTHDHTTVERLGREVMVDNLTSGHPGLATSTLRKWGYRGDRLCGFVLSSRSRSVVLEPLVLRWLDELGLPHLIRTDKDKVVGFISPQDTESFRRLLTYAVSEDRVPIRCGLGREAAVEDLASSFVQARHAHEVAVADALPFVRYQQLPTVELLLNHLDAASLASLRHPLDRVHAQAPDANALIETIRVFLSEHGSGQLASQKLGIHRHTLRKRIERFETLAGLSMKNPDDRFTTWMALREQVHSETG